MLVLTEAAAEVVKSVTVGSDAPEGSGLRIAGPEPDGSGNMLQVSAVPGPRESDQVIEAAGARVFLEPRAAAYLDDKVLDAQVDDTGKAHFTLDSQHPDQV